MSHLTQQVEHVRRAIAYALWNAQDDGREPLELMADPDWLSRITGQFLALEVRTKRIPDVEIKVDRPVYVRHHQELTS
jgi:hypothetical protein